MLRPEHIPDFDQPPIIEAVISVQFTPPAAYREIYARDVWALFEGEFERVQEQPALQPFYKVSVRLGSPGIQISWGPFSAHCAIATGSSAR